jgi:hypothetical protein
MSPGLRTPFRGRCGCLVYGERAIADCKRHGCKTWPPRPRSTSAVSRTGILGGRALLNTSLALLAWRLPDMQLANGITIGPYLSNHIHYHCYIWIDNTCGQEKHQVLMNRKWSASGRSTCTRCCDEIMPVISGMIRPENVKVAVPEKQYGMRVGQYKLTQAPHLIARRKRRAIR